MDFGLPSVNIKKPRKDVKFDFDEFIFNFRKPLTTILGGLVLIGFGLIIFKSSSFLDSSKVEILKSSDTSLKDSTLKTNPELVVEISGAVQSPGVYRLKQNSRVDDLLIVSGGVSGLADREWVNRYINRAQKLSDGQKVYIPKVGEKLTAKSENSNQNLASDTLGISSQGLININTASQKELEDLPGIGPVYAQSIIEKRIYSSIEELVSKGALKKATYEKLKDKISVN